KPQIAPGGEQGQQGQPQGQGVNFHHQFLNSRKGKAKNQQDHEPGPCEDWFVHIGSPRLWLRTVPSSPVRLQGSGPGLVSPSSGGKNALPNSQLLKGL